MDDSKAGPKAPFIVKNLKQLLMIPDNNIANPDYVNRIFLKIVIFFVGPDLDTSGIADTTNEATTSSFKRSRALSNCC